jgi:serine protease AprX
LLTYSLRRAQIGENVVYFQKDSSSSQMIAYDLNKNKYIKVNLVNPINKIAGEGDRMCFVNSVNHFVYCFDYDKNIEYPDFNSYTNSKIVGGYNFVNNTDDFTDDNGHGTHVSGIIAGNGSLKGVAPGVQLVEYKVMGGNGLGSTSSILSALDAALATRIDDDPTNDISILNLSLGSNCPAQYVSYCGPDDLMSKALDNLSNYGVVSVVAAGNNGSSPSRISSPGTSRTAITVGSVSKANVISSFSSRGPVVYGSEVIVKPDVVAPGEDICSAELFNSLLPQKRCLINQDNAHIMLSGTSMAAPHVAGLVALVMQYHPDWTPLQIKETIKNNADDLSLDPNTQGTGLINAVKIFGMTPTPIPPFKTARIVASEDAYVSKSYLNRNFGKEKYLILDNNPKRIAYLKFDLSKLAGKEISKVKLSVKVPASAKSFKNAG